MTPIETVVHVVDDDAAIRHAVVFQLETAGYAARHHASAEAFLDALAQAPVGCVITDVRMPGIGGLALQQRLRALGSAMPVIIITSYTDPITRARALEGGARAFLTKPVADDFLLHHLRSALGQDGAEEEAGGKVPVGR